MNAQCSHTVTHEYSMFTYSHTGILNVYTQSHMNTHVHIQSHMNAQCSHTVTHEYSCSHTVTHECSMFTHSHT